MEPVYCALFFRGVWQWLLVSVDPSPIAQVDKASAQRASFEVLGLAQSRTGDLFAHDGAARKWIFQARDFHLTTSQKNQAPDFSEARSYTARGTSAR
jgi:hypothetical protein